ncbi:hypothetical protein CN311_12075 [Mesorhizobium sanjuanii]|uniref:Uncharacterized protein n=1 Tax=Mesorhizobium sanjuanii TaxID=2037900 RepID=A0A2A6FGC5_9HYPH|nr:hypothetical protein CN311_12075 [Mesorhizobium sanjuanii]
MRPFLILSLCNRSYAGPVLARSKPRRDEWPERERAYRKKDFGSQSGAVRPTVEVLTLRCDVSTKDEFGKKAVIA